MDELINNLGTFEVTPYPNNPHAEHPRFSLFKLKSSGSSQEERRQKILEARKQARYDAIAHLRKLEEGEEVTDDEEQDMDSADNVAVCYARPKKYRNFIMLSEWLVDIPEDFGETYLSLPCPVGKRNIVVSVKGRTRAYAKNGTLRNHFSSHLPGGSPSSYSGFTCLDCIWSQSNNTFYVIDIMVWNTQSFIECETEFRFTWLKWRFDELDNDISKESQNNTFKFIRVPSYSSTSDSLTQMIHKPMPFEVELDGVLFYHKLSHYTHGPTPLVGWLKAYMFPELFNMEVPEHYMKQMPERYVNLTTHIQYKKELVDAKKREKANKMEVANSEGLK